MKNIIANLFCLCLFLIHGIVAQSTTPINLNSELNDALIHKNKKLLQELLSDKLTYGHSNGWIEDKKELLENNEKEILVYKKIQCDSISSWIEGKSCILRFKASISGTLKMKNFDLELKVIQVWVRKKSTWKLLARQSVKVG